MRILKLTAVVLVAWVAVSAAADDKPASPNASPPPIPTGVTESVEKRLVQLDVGVEGDPEAIRVITAKDFVLYVGEHEIQGLIVDRLCGDEPPQAPASPQAETAPAPPPSVAPPTPHQRATFVFFFDQPHLTMAGRLQSLETSRDLIQRLVVEGTRASIVSNAERMTTIVPLTGDRDKLLAGLEKIRTDSKQWEAYSETERRRAEEVGSADAQGPLCAPALPLARLYAREERQEVRQSTQRLAITVGALAEEPAPKSLVYFADTLRQKAGLHYLHLVSCPTSTDAESGEMIPSAAAELDAVTNEAQARGVHFFTIQAEGLVATFPGWDSERHRAAADTLVSMAAETGGEAFLGGASRDFIGNRIAARTSCGLLLSFPPGDLPRDTPLPITIELHVPNVKLRAQGGIVVPSPGSIEKARLLAAFADPGSSDDGSLRVLLIPRGGDGKVWHAGFQLRLRPSGFPDTGVELGASIVRDDVVYDHFASSIGTSSGSRSVVLEKSLDVVPGKFSVVAVARDVKRGDLASSRLEANWPNPAKSVAAITPIAVLQNGPAAIAKDGEAHSSGSLARDVDEPLDAERNVVLTSVVCRGAKTKAPVVVERWLEGRSHDEFVPMTIEPGEAPCIQTVDVVRAGRLIPGVFDYRIVARVGDEIVAQQRRTLRVGAVGGAR